MLPKPVKRIITALVTAGLLLSGLTTAKITAAIPVPVSSQSSFESWLSKTGKPVFSRYHSYRANYAVYRDYKLLTYGRPQDVSGIRYDSKTKQYSAHGFSYDEFVVTNTFFPEDSNVISDPSKWKNIDLGRDAEISWLRLSEREKQFIKKTQIFYMGRSFGKMTFTSLKLTQAKCVVIAVPSWYLGFALYTSHYNSKGERRYGTLHGNGIGSASINCTLSIPGNSSKVIHIPYGKDYADVKLSALCSVSGFTGLALSGDIASGGIVFAGKSIESAGSGPWKIDPVKRYYRTGTDRTVMQTRSVTEKAKVWAVTAMGDIMIKEVSIGFTIIEDPVPVPKQDATGVLSIRGDIGFFRDGRSMAGYPIPKNDKRFLCYERVTARLDLAGGNMPSKVVFDLPGGPFVEVPVIKTGTDRGYASFSYYIGEIPSTVTWQNVRIRLPYICKASAYFGTRRIDHSLGGIDITGSIYDIVYFQGKPAGC